jgi:hypothetical protein
LTHHQSRMLRLQGPDLADAASVANGMLCPQGPLGPRCQGETQQHTVCCVCNRLHTGCCAFKVCCQDETRQHTVLVVEVVWLSPTDVCTLVKREFVMRQDMSCLIGDLQVAGWQDQGDVHTCQLLSEREREIYRDRETDRHRDRGDASRDGASARSAQATPSK